MGWMREGGRNSSKKYTDGSLQTQEIYRLFAKTFVFPRVFKEVAAM